MGNALSIEEFGLPTPEPLAAARLERPVLVRPQPAGGEGLVHVAGGGGGGEGEVLGWGGGAAAAAAARGRGRLLGAGAATFWRWGWRHCLAWSGGFGGCGCAWRGGFGGGGFGAFRGGLAGGVVGVVVVAGADGDRGGGGGGGGGGRGGGGCCSRGRGGGRGQADGSVGQDEDLRVVGGVEELLLAPVHILVIRKRSLGGRRRPALTEGLEFFSLAARAA